MPALRNLLIGVIVAVLLAGCGVRGDPEPPPGAEEQPQDPPFVLDPLVSQRRP